MSANNHEAISRYLMDGSLTHPVAQALGIMWAAIATQEKDLRCDLTTDVRLSIFAVVSASLSLAVRRGARGQYM